MAPNSRKRRAPQDDSESEVEEPRNTNHRDNDDSASEDEHGEDAAAQADQIQQLARKLVRYALSCEYSRQPIRRTDITTKVLGVHSRRFKSVLPEAQLMLKSVFGMEMVELPKAEKITLQQRRAAQRNESNSQSSGNYVLATILPTRFRDPAIIPPPRVPESDEEATYIGLYTLVVALIYLSSGALSESRLDRFLLRLNADQNTPLDRTDKLLQRMEAHNYIKKIKDSSSGEEVVEYIVGPRGKIEIGEDGVEAFVKKVYGPSGDESLSERLAKSLALTQRPAGAVNGTDGGLSVPNSITRGDRDVSYDVTEGLDFELNGVRRRHRSGPNFEIHQDDG